MRPSEEDKGKGRFDGSHAEEEVHRQDDSRRKHERSHRQRSSHQRRSRSRSSSPAHSEALGESSHRRSKHRHRHEHRSRHRRRRSPPSSTARSSAKDNAKPSAEARNLFGDDLFAAERWEKEQREREKWEDKLRDLADEDEGDAGFFGSGAAGRGSFRSTYDEEMQYEVNRAALDATSPRHFSSAQQRIPQRHVNAAGGGAGMDYYQRAAHLDELTEEEYAEYMREGMWRRHNAEAIRAQEEAARQAEREKKRKAEKEASRKEKERAKQKERERKSKQDELSHLNEAREQWEKAWQDLRSITSKDEGKALYFSDLPWPCLSMWPRKEDQQSQPSAALKYPQLDRKAISYFLLGPADAQSSTEDEQAKSRARLRQALLRYHPDRFTSAPWFSRIPEADGLRDKVKECLLQVARILNDLQAENRTQ